MADLLKGKPVADALDLETTKKVAALKEKGITPTLAIVRVGKKEEDLSYERAAMKRLEKVGAAVKNVVLPVDTTNEALLKTIEDLNADKAVHGILLFQPLPKGLDAKAAVKTIAPEKDVDGAGPGSYAAIYSGNSEGGGFAPCTAQAVLEMLKFYNIPMEGKRAVVIGRSLVIGKPVSLLLMQEQATVTICHSRTQDMPSITKEADIVVAALGKAEFLTGDYFAKGQTVIDVGIHYSEEKQKLVGDVLTEEAADKVAAISPVPGGVGSVTTAVLASHVAEAAQRAVEK